MLTQVNTIILEAQENYNKRSFRNKFLLLSDKGPVVFSIPLVKGKNRSQPIRDTRISYDTDWPRAIWRSIETFYGSSPFYEYYASELHQIIHSKEKYLFEFNWRALEWMCQKMGIATQFAMNLEYNNIDSNCTDIRSCFLPKSSMMHHAYPQVFEDKLGFIHNLSGLDLLFAYGPASADYLNHNSVQSKYQI